MSRPVVLLPPSRGKASGGSGAAYGTTIVGSLPLAAARRDVLTAASEGAGSLSDADLARVAGVGASHVAEARRSLAALAEAPTLPANERYQGVVHRNAGLAGLDPSTLDVDVRIVSALLGLVALDGPVPGYRLEFTASLPPLGGLATFWRDHLAEHLSELADGVRVWDLLPGEHARVWPPGLRDQVDVVSARFVRPDGRAANAARTKVAKGRLVAWLIATPDAGPGRTASDADLGPGWSLVAEGGTLTATSDI